MKAVHCKPVTLAILLCSYPGIVVAQNPPNVEAGQHFERGLALAKQRAYPEAIGEFNRAYQISPHFSVMYNLGQAYMAIDQPVYAVEALRRYLDEGRSEVPPSRRESVEASIATQERRIATITVRSDREGAVVRIDGNEIGRTPLASPIRISAGNHVLDAVLPGHKPWEQGLSLVGQEQKTVDIRFEPVVAVVAPASPVTIPASPVPVASGTMVQPSPVVTPAPGIATLDSAPSPATNLGRRTTAYVVGAAGVGSLVVGSVFGLRAYAKKSDSDKACPSEQCTTEGVRLNNQAKTAANVSTITFSVGLAAVGVAAYLLLRPGSARPQPSGTLAHRLRIVPDIGRGQAGVAVGGVW